MPCLKKPQNCYPKRNVKHPQSSLDRWAAHHVSSVCSLICFYWVFPHWLSLYPHEQSGVKIR